MKKWKYIVGFEGHYKISNHGDVLSTKRVRNKVLKNRINSYGYHHVYLSKDGKQFERLVHRLVMQHFSNDTPKETVNHIDGNKTNNHIDNLEWATRSEQMIHAYKHNLKKPSLHAVRVLTDEEAKEIRSLYVPHCKQYGMIALAKKYNVSNSTIDKLVRNVTYRELL